MLWAASCVCFFVFFRVGEITVPTDNSYDASRHLNFQDLAVDNQLNPFKYSKTDQLGSGLDIILGRTYQDICPVATAMACLAVRRDGEGPLFKFADGWYLTKERFTCRIREALVALGLRSEDYAGHSFRIGLIKHFAGMLNWRGEQSLEGRGSFLDHAE